MLCVGQAQIGSEPRGLHEAGSNPIGHPANAAQALLERNSILGRNTQEAQIVDDHLQAGVHKAIDVDGQPILSQPRSTQDEKQELKVINTVQGDMLLERV